MLYKNGTLRVITQKDLVQREANRKICIDNVAANMFVSHMKNPF